MLLSKDAVGGTVFTKLDLKSQERWFCVNALEHYIFSGASGYQLSPHFQGGSPSYKVENAFNETMLKVLVVFHRYFLHMSRESRT